MDFDIYNTIIISVLLVMDKIVLTKYMKDIK